MIFRMGVRTAHPEAFFAQDEIQTALKKASAECTGRCIVLGAGKAAAAMAATLEKNWPGDLEDSPSLEGVVITRTGYDVPTSGIEVVLGAHPHPGEASGPVAMRMLELAAGLTANDLLIGLWSGGGSALLACPPEDVSFDRLRKLTKHLLNSGANIHEINSVRKHLSQIAGGQLAKAASPARLLNLIIPDVVRGSDEAVTLSAIASGPCVPDPTTQEQALAVLAEYEIDVSDEISKYLKNPTNETPGNWAELDLTHYATHVLEPDVAVENVARIFETREYALAKIDAEVTGDATEAAKRHAHLAKSIATMGQRAAIVTGGEVTVNVTGTGTGGPNQEYALALALELDGAENIHAVAGDTDGIDGFGEAAGAFVAPDTLARMLSAGIDPAACLANNDASTAFAAIDDLLITGPTFTNVNDLRLIVING